MLDDSLIPMLEVQHDCTMRFLAELKRDPSRPNALDLIRRTQSLLREIEGIMALTAQPEQQ